VATAAVAMLVVVVGVGHDSFAWLVAWVRRRAARSCS